MFVGGMALLEHLQENPNLQYAIQNAIGERSFCRVDVLERMQEKLKLCYACPAFLEL